MARSWKISPVQANSTGSSYRETPITVCSPVVLAAYLPTDAPVTVTAVDLCETPLQLCRWYGDRLSLTVDTHACDILDFETPEPFDVICSHSFLGYFTPRERIHLLEKWRELLRPGGRIIGINRIRDADAPDVIVFTPEQARAFVERTARRAEERRHLLDVSPDEVTEWARIYAERFRIRPVRSRGEVANLFTQAGMEVSFLDAGVLPGDPTGPTTPGGADLRAPRGHTPVRICVARPSIRPGQVPTSEMKVSNFPPAPRGISSR